MNNVKTSMVYAAWILLICILLAVIIIAFSFLACPLEKADLSALKIEQPSVLVIIDAGHGGRDGGAVSDDGVAEKDLNLQIALKLRDLLTACGVECMMTRETDALVCDENDPALKGKIKQTDLKNRLQIAKDHPSAVFVSIHMNKFPQEKYFGLQVYYSKNNTQSNDLANEIQKNTRKHLQPQNSRKIKAADSKIFLLDRIQSPAVLVECGFLSNREECKRLCSGDYQNELAYILCFSLMKNMDAGV